MRSKASGMRLKSFPSLLQDKSIVTLDGAFGPTDLSPASSSSTVVPLSSDNLDARAHPAVPVPYSERYMRYSEQLVTHTSTHDDIIVRFPLDAFLLRDYVGLSWSEGGRKRARVVVELG